MSTHDPAFGDHVHHSRDVSIPTADALSAIESAYRDLEPKARELNRTLTDLFGPRRDGEMWAYLGQSDDHVYRVFITPVDTSEVLPLVAHLNCVIDKADETDICIRRSSTDASVPFPGIVGEAARLSAIPTTHVKIVRGR